MCGLETSETQLTPTHFLPSTLASSQHPALLKEAAPSASMVHMKGCTGHLLPCPHPTNSCPCPTPAAWPFPPEALGYPQHRALSIFTLTSGGPIKPSPLCQVQCTHRAHTYTLPPGRGCKQGTVSVRCSRKTGAGRLGQTEGEITPEGKHEPRPLSPSRRPPRMSGSTPAGPDRRGPGQRRGLLAKEFYPKIGRAHV